MRWLLVFVLAAGCASQTPRGVSSITPAGESDRPTTPAMIRIPDGWTDIATSSREDAEAQMPGFYDKTHPMVARNGYRAFAFDLREGSPDRGAMMTLLPMRRKGPVDEAFLDAFVADNNLNLEASSTVEKKLCP